MKKLIVTADDYGVIPSINSGIINAINLNKINSVAVLSNYEGSIEYKSSIENVHLLMDETHGNVDLGVHFTITSGRPLTGADAKSMCEDGCFRDYTEFRREIDLTALKNELDAQIVVMQDAGFNPKWASSHHNILTLFPEIFDVYLNVCKNHNLAVRSVDIQPKKNQNLYLLFLRLALIEDILIKDAREIKTFGKEVVEYFKKNAKGLRSTDYMDISDYGPAPLTKIPVASVNHRVEKKLKKLAERLELFKQSERHNLELVFHLIEADICNIDPYNSIDYSGINRRYFDSRILEAKALKEFDFSEIQFGIWEQMNPI